MINIAFGILLIANGLVHAMLVIAPNPSDPDEKPGAFFTSKERSWQLSKLSLNSVAIRWIGILLVGLSTSGFVLAGLGIWGSRIGGDLTNLSCIVSVYLNRSAYSILASLVVNWIIDQCWNFDRAAVGFMATCCDGW